MRDGAPNGYSIITFDGNDYSIRFKAARRPWDHQMTIFAPDQITVEQAAATEIVVNVFAGSPRSTVEMRLGTDGPWTSLRRMEREDPYFAAMKQREQERNIEKRKLPRVEKSRHLWVATLPSDPPEGSHVIHVRTTDMFGQTFEDYRIIAIRP
jgi:hypothetical protein